MPNRSMVRECCHVTRLSVYFPMFFSQPRFTCYEHATQWRKVISFQLEFSIIIANLPMFRLNAPVVIRAKVRKSEQTLLFIASALPCDTYWG